MATSSGLVLLCSFWCHCSIMPPLQWLRLWIERISSRMRWPWLPSPPRPTEPSASVATLRAHGLHTLANLAHPPARVGPDIAPHGTPAAPHSTAVMQTRRWPSECSGSTKPKQRHPHDDMPAARAPVHLQRMQLTGTSRLVGDGSFQRPVRSVVNTSSRLHPPICMCQQCMRTMQARCPSARR